jgi:hypothetical protein
LARSCWSDTVMGKSLRKTGTERERDGEQHREVCFWLVLSRGFLLAGVSSRALEAHSRTLGKLLLVWHSVVPTVVQEQCLFVQLPGMLQAGVDGSCLHAPKNWLVRQQIDLRDNKVSTQSRIY